MKLKVPPPLVFAVAAVLTWVVSALFPDLSVRFPGQIPLAGLLVCLGLLPDILALKAFWQRKTTVNPMAPDKTSALVTDGIYRLSRNPMYLGLACLLLGVSLYFGSLLSLVLFPAFLWYLTEFQIKPEENQLRRIFGAAYEDYCQNVRRWI